MNKEVYLLVQIEPYEPPDLICASTDIESLRQLCCSCNSYTKARDPSWEEFKAVNGGSDASYDTWESRGDLWNQNHPANLVTGKNTLFDRSDEFEILELPLVYNRIQDPAYLIPENEPVFLLRGQDPLAPSTLEFWAAVAVERNVDPVMVELELVQAKAKAMRLWQLTHRTKTLPDLQGVDEPPVYGEPVLVFDFNKIPIIITKDPNTLDTVAGLYYYYKTCSCLSLEPYDVLVALREGIIRVLTQSLKDCLPPAGSLRSVLTEYGLLQRIDQISAKEMDDLPFYLNPICLRPTGVDNFQVVLWGGTFVTLDNHTENIILLPYEYSIHFTLPTALNHNHKHRSIINPRFIDMARYFDAVKYL